MADFSCPGSKLIKQPVPESTECPHCHGEVEIWSDEGKAMCHNCGKKVSRDMPPSCIEWCKWARECLGEETYERYMEERVKSEK